MAGKSELESFDGKDNRKEIMVLLVRLGSDRRRAEFLESLIPSSLKGFAGCPMRVCGPAHPVAAYFMLVAVCNEIGVSINEAARRLEGLVKRGPEPEGVRHDRVGRRLGRPDDLLAVRRVLHHL